MAEDNPLFTDRELSFQLRELHDLPSLLSLPAFADHSLETCEMYVDAAKTLARKRLFPRFREIDVAATKLEGGEVKLPEASHEAWAAITELGATAATRPAEVGGSQLPHLAAAAAHALLMAGNGSAYAFVGLTTGAARLVESFGSEALRARFLDKMYSGAWSGTMALTEPQAGSSLSDVATKASPGADGTHLIEGTKVFISGGAHDLTENTVHLVLARIEGAPAGAKGVSLFAVPQRREGEGGALEDNDVTCTGVFEKIGWKGIPSVQLSFGERGDCRAWLVGQAHRGIHHMFQMMNEARLMVGLNGVATAAAAYHESRLYALERTQGRPMGQKDPSLPQVPLVRHADVRRMLLRQKAIVEAGLTLALEAARLTDVVEHGNSEAAREEARLLLELVIPVAKTFPAEYGFEANTLAVQVLGGYGYTKEYLPEAFLRDQKLNSIHEGTSGIQALDLLGRKVVMSGGAALEAMAHRILEDVGAARSDGVPASQTEPLGRALAAIGELTRGLAAKGMADDPEGMLAHASAYMRAFSIVLTSWAWVRQSAAARRALSAGASGESADFYRGKIAAADYWLATELPEVAVLVELCASGERSFADCDPAWL